MPYFYPMTYGLLLWGNQVERVSKVQKKSIRLITGSEYLAHSEPLFKELELLKIEDLYKLKIFKFYYNLSCGLLPSYFNCYLDVLKDLMQRKKIKIYFSFYIENILIKTSSI